MMWDGIDARKFPRVNYKCRIKVFKDGRENVIDTSTENIGQGGICVSLPEDIGIFKNVDLEMFLGEENESVKCRGKAVWVVKGHPASAKAMVLYDTGIEFIDIKEEDRKKVETLVGDLLRGKA